MDVNVELRLQSSKTVDDLIGLSEWLRGERRLQGRVQQVRSNPEPGQLGGAFEVVSVALGSGGIATVLASSVATWLQSRRSDPKLRITITRADRTLEIEASSADEAEDLIKRFMDGTRGD
ncbi:effector-associated constant component EACC1 [Streptomyces gardneri]|uniref:effector-associated constant component EACC1 n=1 Tax=Streptomyces gardneri TaxID=66892 RepID=UPI0033EE2FD4